MQLSSWIAQAVQPVSEVERVRLRKGFVDAGLFVVVMLLFGLILRYVSSDTFNQLRHEILTRPIFASIALSLLLVIVVAWILFERLFFCQDETGHRHFSREGIEEVRLQLLLRKIIRSIPKRFIPDHAMCERAAEGLRSFGCRSYVQVREIGHEPWFWTLVLAEAFDFREGKLCCGVDLKGIMDDPIEPYFDHLTSNDENRLNEPSEIE
ncbi:hypothetical protein KBB27_01735 [Patescibacteria group bacterium]|nr:hypothetical protein [Patescibacteria group bacterium]